MEKQAMNFLLYFLTGMLFITLTSCGEEDPAEPLLPPQELLAEHYPWKSAEIRYQGQPIDSLLIEWTAKDQFAEGKIIYHTIELALDNNTNWQGYSYRRENWSRYDVNTDFTITPVYDAYTFKDWNVTEDSIRMEFQFDLEPNYNWYSRKIQFVNNEKFIIQNFPIHILYEGSLERYDFTVNGMPVSQPGVLGVDITFEP